MPEGCSREIRLLQSARWWKEVPESVEIVHRGDFIADASLMAVRRPHREQVNFASCTVVGLDAQLSRVTSSHDVKDCVNITSRCGKPKVTWPIMRRQKAL
jgi:hypothetical protein